MGFWRRQELLLTQQQKIRNSWSLNTLKLIDNHSMNLSCLESKSSNQIWNIMLMNLKEFLAENSQSNPSSRINFEDLAQISENHQKYSLQLIWLSLTFCLHPYIILSSHRFWLVYDKLFALRFSNYTSGGASNFFFKGTSVFSKGKLWPDLYEEHVWTSKAEAP